ncbi:MAG: hypothetical protein ABL951_05615 [Alphaproteobacteria bacterium]
MAILVVLIKENSHPDPELNKLRCQVNDVVDIVEDDHEFTFGELNSGRYKFVNIPGVLAEEFEHLREVERDSEDPEKIVNIRVRKIDLSMLDDKLLDAASKNEPLIKDDILSITLDRK